MKKKLFSAIVAALLVFGLAFISCDTNSDDPASGIPSALQGTYEFSGGLVMVINANGSGSINGDACTFSVDNDILTVKMGAETVNVKFTPQSGGLIKFEISGTPGAGALKTLLDAIVAADPVKPGDTQGGGKDDVIPAALQGEWVLVNDVPANPAVFISELVPAGTKVFDIKGDGTGTARNSVGGGHDPATWSVNGNKLTLTTSSAGSSLTCTYTYAIAANGQLSLSEPVSGSGLYDYLLEGFADLFSPFMKGEGSTEPGEAIDDFEWVATIPWQFKGTWAMDYLGTPFPIFIIAEGANQGMVWSAVQEKYLEVTWESAAVDGKTKILLTVSGVGSCMFDVSIVSDEIVFSDAISDGAGGNILAGYTAFTPLFKSPFDGGLTWSDTIPSQYTGSWAMDYLGTPFPIFEIISGADQGKVWSAVQLVMLDVTWKSSSFLGQDKILLTITGLGSCMFDVSIVDGKLIFSKPVSDSAISNVLEGYTAFTPLFSEWTTVYYDLSAAPDAEALQFHAENGSITIQKIFVNDSKSSVGATYLFDFTDDPGYSLENDTLYWANDDFTSKITDSGTVDGGYALAPSSYVYGGGFGSPILYNHQYLGFVVKCDDSGSIRYLIGKGEPFAELDAVHFSTLLAQ